MLTGKKNSCSEFKDHKSWGLGVLETTAVPMPSTEPGTQEALSKSWLEESIVSSVPGLLMIPSHTWSHSTPSCALIYWFPSPFYRRKPSSWVLKGNLGSPNQVEDVLCLSQPVSSVAQSCPTVCNPMDCSTPGLPVHHQLPEFTQTHLHWVSPTISSSIVPLSSCLQSFPASGSFPMSQLFTGGGQSTGVSASASVLPMNI